METRITKNVSLTNNLTMNNFWFEFTPTDSSAGGTLLYIANHLPYKTCLDINICRHNELEYTFIEILNPKKSYIIIGCIYKHPSMDFNDFATNYLNNLLDKVSKEQKFVFPLGAFNINFLNYNNPGIYSSNFDVCYMARKTQSSNWVFKLYLHKVSF